MYSREDTKSVENVGEKGVKKEVKNGQNDFLERIVDVMRENQKFLLPYSNPQNKSVGHEVLGLISDADRHTRFFTSGNAAESYADSCIRPYVLLILRPFSHAMYTDLLSSNTVACFIELRLIVESLVKFYYADMKYPEKASFQEKIRLLEEDMRSGEKSLSNLVRECGWEKSTKKVGYLWRQLSEGWLHTRGIVERIVDEVTSKTGIPAWLRGHQAYTQADLGVLQDLRKTIAAFRHVQAQVIEHWKNLLQNQSPKAEKTS